MVHTPALRPNVVRGVRVQFCTSCFLSRRSSSLLAYTVMRATQHTSTDELESPELGSMLPSTRRSIPRGFSRDGHPLRSLCSHTAGRVTTAVQFPSQWQSACRKRVIWDEGSTLENLMFGVSLRAQVPDDVHPSRATKLGFHFLHDAMHKPQARYLRSSSGAPFSRNIPQWK